MIPNRALNINIPLDVLSVDWDIERKRQWLQDWVMERIAANAIRHYAEPTFHLTNNLLSKQLNQALVQRGIQLTESPLISGQAD